jgi:hypothetical protein
MVIQVFIQVLGPVSEENPRLLGCQKPPCCALKTSPFGFGVVFFIFFTKKQLNHLEPRMGYGTQINCPGSPLSSITA